MTTKDLKALLEKSTSRPWTIERVDHEKAITYEIGPRPNGSYGHRFILSEYDYDERGEFGKLKMDSYLIVAAVNELPKLIEKCEAYEEALVSVSKNVGHSTCTDKDCPYGCNYVARVDAVLNKYKDKE